jgi:hypothetical protein
VNRVSDNTLIEVTDLDLDVAGFVGERTQVAQVAVTITVRSVIGGKVSGLPS